MLECIFRENVGRYNYADSYAKINEIGAGQLRDVQLCWVTGKFYTPPPSLNPLWIPPGHPKLPWNNWHLNPIISHLLQKLCFLPTPTPCQTNTPPQPPSPEASQWDNSMNTKISQIGSLLPMLAAVLANVHDNGQHMDDRIYWS